ncbi:beta-ketoacyl synthase N-terminal-like domain-containing protein, partial [Nocardia tenerifensis]|uniref:beta-ketoacyl synthase N-terminal-like domain-containing protein n=1 Tax=Nocardia tenerifensis TaxID=228006 RepID=UPI0026E55927
MSGRRRVVVTGFGAVNAAGSNVADFEQNLRKSASCLTRITAFDAEDFPVRVAGQVTDLRAADHVPRRFLAKTDRFTHLSFVSTDEALADAGLDLAGEDRSRVGVWFGNNTGGWDLCERGFLEYYRDGADVVNPWQATAWFLAAPQGFTTIRYGITGMSKSFSGDRTSGASAIYYGARSIGWGRTDVVLAGGCEAPVTPLSIACHGSTRAEHRRRSRD